MLLSGIGETCDLEAYKVLLFYTLYGDTMDWKDCELFTLLCLEFLVGDF